jgi:hypothetical protein
MIFRAITSLAISPRSASRSAMSAISYASPMTRSVSVSNLWPLRWTGSALASPAIGGSATELSATDAWGRAAVDDITSVCCLQ